MQRFLFICSANKLRSPTAEQVFSQYPNIEATSAGLNSDAIDTLTPEHLEGVDIVFDAVGGALFEPCLKSLAVGGRQIAITSMGERRVSFDLLDFYHNKLELIGVDTLKLDGQTIAGILDTLRPGFEGGQLKPFEVQTWPFDQAIEAYEAAAKGGAAKQVLLPQG